MKPLWKSCHQFLIPGAMPSVSLFPSGPSPQGSPTGPHRAQGEGNCTQGRRPGSTWQAGGPLRPRLALARWAISKQQGCWQRPRACLVLLAAGTCWARRRCPVGIHSDDFISGLFCGRCLDDHDSSLWAMCTEHLLMVPRTWGVGQEPSPSGPRLGWALCRAGLMGEAACTTPSGELGGGCHMSSAGSPRCSCRLEMPVDSGNGEHCQQGSEMAGIPSLPGFLGSWSGEKPAEGWDRPGQEQAGDGPSASGPSPGTDGVQDGGGGWSKESGLPGNHTAQCLTQALPLTSHTTASVSPSATGPVTPTSPGQCRSLTHYLRLRPLPAAGAGPRLPARLGRLFPGKLRGRCARLAFVSVRQP